MPRIEIGAGLVLAALAPLGILGYIPVVVILLVFGVFLILHGSYEEFIKPHFHVEHRLKDWFLRRAWSVQTGQMPSLLFYLKLRSASSDHEVNVSREKETRTRGDFISFTGLVPLHPDWTGVLNDFTLREHQVLHSDIRIYLTGKDLSFKVTESPNDEIHWPLCVFVTTAIPQDHTLSQHSADMTAKSVELSMIGVRDVIRKAVALHVTSPESTPDMGGSQPQ